MKLGENAKHPFLALLEGSLPEGLSIQKRFLIYLKDSHGEMERIFAHFPDEEDCLQKVANGGVTIPPHCCMDSFLVLVDANTGNEFVLPNRKWKDGSRLSQMAGSSLAGFRITACIEVRETTATGTDGRYVITKKTSFIDDKKEANELGQRAKNFRGTTVSVESVYILANGTRKFFLARQSRLPIPI